MKTKSKVGKGVVLTTPVAVHLDPLPKTTYGRDLEVVSWVNKKELPEICSNAPKSRTHNPRDPNWETRAVWDSSIWGKEWQLCHWLWNKQMLHIIIFYSRNGLRTWFF